MRGIFNKIPKLGKKMEIIFVEGHSKDATYKLIDEEIKKYRGSIKTKLYKQKGKGKGDAVRLGFSKASNELLMILDADLTVDPEELPKFYTAIKEGKGELVMGSRLIYPMEKQAMRTLNILGNKFFSMAFSFLLDQKIKDTLCGTKALLKEDYMRISRNRKIFGDFDPFGDYDLIFGAAKMNMKILEIPVRYKERIYGSTNISRFTHGWLLLKMAYFAAKRLKFI
jgi:glycosyltransferase involved in cell wall biosynthesis